MGIIHVSILFSIQGVRAAVVNLTRYTEIRSRRPIGDRTHLANPNPTMTASNQTDDNQSPVNQTTGLDKVPEKILCPHCLRTATNKIKCQGICVADSDY
jgi:hypothetical protein